MKMKCALHALLAKLAQVRKKGTDFFLCMLSRFFGQIFFLIFWSRAHSGRHRIHVRLHKRLRVESAHERMRCSDVRRGDSVQPAREMRHDARF